MGFFKTIYGWFGHWTDGGSVAETDPARIGLLRQLSALEALANRLFVMIGIFIALYSFAQPTWPSAHPHTLIALIGFFGAGAKVFGILLGVMICFAIMGGFLGFLFGIPRLLQHSATQPLPAPVDGSKPGSANNNGETARNSAAAQRFLSSNTNLEEISDWITKIIVGLSLVQAGFIFEKIKKASVIFKTNALPEAAGADIVFVLVLVGASIAGFLFFYMETRTRVALILGDLENIAATSRTVSDNKVLAAVLDAPIVPAVDARGSGRNIESAPAPIDEDKKLLAKPYNELESADELAAWGSAQARANNFQAALRALQDAIAKKPDDKNLLVRLADVQQRRGNARGAYDSISEARQKNKDDPILLRRELQASLYLAAPESFQKALGVAEKLQADATVQDDATVQLWIACAQGQRYKWLLENGGTDVDKADARTKALAAVQRVVAIETNPNGAIRALLRGVFDPSPPEISAGEDDLRVFNADQEFRRLIIP